MSRLPQDKESDAAPEGSWRRPLLHTVLRLTAIVCTVWLAAIFAAVPMLIGTVFGIGDIIFLAAVWVASGLSLSERTRFAVIEIALFGSSVNAILVYGSSPGLPVLLGLFVLLATVYHDRKGGIIAGVASLLLVAAGAWGWLVGLLPLGTPMPTLSPGAPDLWVRTFLAQFLSVCAIIGIITYVLKEMQRSLFRLKLAEEKFSKAFRISPDAMVITELATGRFLEVNAAHERMTGFAREEILGKTSLEIGTFRTAAEREAFWAPLVATGSVQETELRIRNRKGVVIDVVCSAECFDLAGLRCAVTIIRDVTEQKSVQAALKDNEARFRSFIENASVGIYRSTPGGRIVMANPALVRMMGYESFDQMASRNLENEGYEPSYPRREFRETIERQGLLNGWEAEWKRRDGASIFVRESATVIRGPDGSVQYYDGFIEDISERKRAEQALRESEERFRNLTEAAFEGLVITENGLVLDINDQALSLIGCERAEVLGRPAADFVSEESREVVAEHIRTGSEASYEHYLVRKDGTKFRAEAHARMMHMGGRLLRMTALRDVTERRQAEERQKNFDDQLRQMQKMEALGTLAGGIAHDFNNILTGIMGNLQIAEMDLSPNHPATPALKSAEQASKRARDLVSQILSFSRPEQENRLSGSLGPVVLEATELLRVGLPKGIEIQTRVEPGIPPVLFDSGQIHQVILNLGTNAVHAMRRKGGQLEVELRPVKPDALLRGRYPQVSEHHAVLLRLRDTGCGMDTTVLKRIFEPFYTTKASGDGTGLGLAMVHAILRSHRGAIVVESAPGRGATFSLYFPAAKASDPSGKPEIPEAGQGLPAQFGKGRRILLVDDNAPIREIGCTLLRRLGFLPEPFERPGEALEAFRLESTSFSAVISDLTMPDMDGVELSRRLLAIQAGVPIILASGNLPAEARQRALAAGVRCLVNKPFEVLELVARVREILGEPPAGSS